MMKGKHVWQVIKGAGESFTLGAGIAGVVFTIIAAFVTVAPIISIPIIAAAGITFAIVGACISHREYKKNEQKEIDRQRKKEHALKSEMDIIRAVHKVEEDLEVIRLDIDRKYNELPKMMSSLPALAQQGRHEHHRHKKSYRHSQGGLSHSLIFSVGQKEKMSANGECELSVLARPGICRSAENINSSRYGNDKQFAFEQTACSKRQR
jgi:hypothetical protein